MAGVKGGVRLESVAYCLRKDCDWTAEGDPEQVDLAARRHSGDRTLAGALRPGHGTTMTTTPVGGFPARAAARGREALPGPAPSDR